MKLFGPAIAFREGGKIMISDLDDDDLATVDARSLFWLPKDEAGRGVLFSRRQGWSYRTPINLVSGWWCCRSEIDRNRKQKYHRNGTTNDHFSCPLLLVAAELVSGPSGHGGSFNSKKWDRGNYVQCG